jgi:ABC-type Co2+ transport system permease subunit
MPFGNHPGFYDLLGALIVSVFSGIISISRRVINGHKPLLLWVISEFMTAILCGYLMYSAYPHIHESAPNWFTLPIAVAFAAHTGGKVFQEVENELVRRYSRLLDRRL